MSEVLIPQDNSVVVAADVKTPTQYTNLVIATSSVDGISGYKVGLNLALEMGLPRLVEQTRDYTRKLVIYDHQKAGNDIPAMGSEFADVCRRAGVDAVILFPFASRVTEIDWIKAAQDAGLGVLVGGHMTQPEFLASEGGFIDNGAPDRIYTIAAEMGVTNFVVPGNKVEYVRHYRNLLEGIIGPNKFSLYAPGFITQGGEISEFAKEAGNRWHAIVGSAIYKAEDQTAAAKLATSQLRTA